MIRSAVLALFLLSNFCSMSQAGFSELDFGISIFKTNIVFKDKTNDNSSSIQEIAQGNLGWSANFNLRVFKKNDLFLETGLIFSHYSSMNMVSNIRFETTPAFDVSSELSKIEVGIPLALGRNIISGKNYECSAKLSFTPVRTFFDLDNIMATQENTPLDEVIELGESIEIKKINYWLSFELPVAYFIREKMKIIASPFFRYKVVSDRNFLRLSDTNDIHLGVSMYFGLRSNTK